MWNWDIAVEILIAISVLSLIAVIPHFIKIFQSVLECFVRWKGTVSLNSSVSLSRSRNFVAASFIIPFILIAARYDLMNLGYDFHPIAETGIYSALFLAFILVRALMRLPRSGKISQKDWECVHSAERNFFIVLVIIEFLTIPVSQLSGGDDAMTKSCILWEIYAVYFIFFFRKGEILYHIRTNFMDILYLCTLEILPVGLTMASKILL